MKRCDLRVYHGVVGNGQRDVIRGRFADMHSPWTPRLDQDRPALGRFPQFPAVMLSTATATGITAMQANPLQLCNWQSNSLALDEVLPSRTAMLTS